MPTRSHADIAADTRRCPDLPPATGASALAAALASHGTELIFGIPGTHNLEIYRELTNHGIRPVTFRHEQGAGYAADGYHLISGRPGVVVTTSGPSFINVLSAAATAFAESRPMLLISPGMPGGTEGQDLGRLHETKDASGAAHRLLEWSRRVSSADEVTQAVADAFELFATGRPRPVHLEIPLDILEGPWSGRIPALREHPVRHPTEDSIGRAADLLRAAREPLIIAGGGARGAAGPLRRVAEAFCAPVVTTANGKGTVPEDHPLSLGANIRLSCIQEASHTADVLLVVGSELGDSDLWGGSVGATSPDVDQQVIRVDVASAQLHKNLPADVALLGDARAALEDLLDVVVSSEHDPSDSFDPPSPARVDDLRAAVQTEFDLNDDLARITRVIQTAAGDDVVIAGDSSQITYGGTVHALVARTPDQLLYMPGHATLGYGIPAAVGAKLASTARPVVALVGDGAAMFSIQEIMTAVELELPVVFVITDNGGYREIEEQMVERGVAPTGVRLARPDFAALGRAMGAQGLTVSTASPDWEQNLHVAVRDGSAQQIPTVIGLIQ
ncbi:thiamine pyrophosphate-binding protein [Nesterenkonia suensis]